MITRRRFIKQSVAATSLASTLFAIKGFGSIFEEEPIQISLAQWSLHRHFWDNKLDPIDFAKIAKAEFDISAVEYVNQFYKGKAEDFTYLNQLKTRAEDNNVRSLLIMIDGEGQLGNEVKSERKKTVENHYKWLDAAKFLGCHSIRVNAAGSGSREDLAARVTESLATLAEFARDRNLNVIVENHGGLSSDANWLSGVLAAVGMENCGSLPDFGNFCIKREPDGKCSEEYDRYQGVKELMPFAKGVSAKSYEFDSSGNEKHTDYSKMLEIVLSSGYTGYIGIEYEGKVDDEFTGIRKTKNLLEKILKIHHELS